MRRRPALLAAAALATLMLVTGCTGGSDAVDSTAADGPGYAQGDGSLTRVAPADRAAQASSVQGQTLDGTALDLADLRGNVVVVNFWGSWCGPCQDEAAELERTYQATRSLGVEFVGVDVKDTVAAAQAFERRHGITYPSLSDDVGSVALRFQELPVISTPTTLVLDRQGRPAARFLGGVTTERLQPVVEAISAEPAA